MTISLSNGPVLYHPDHPYALMQLVRQTSDKMLMYCEFKEHHLDHWVGERVWLPAGEVKLAGPKQIEEVREFIRKPKRLL